MITGDFINIMEKIRTHLYEKSSKPIYDKDRLPLHIWTKCDKEI